MSKSVRHVSLLLLSLFWVWQSNAQDLKLIKKISLKIPEPSGLTHHNTFLYVVSDKNGAIYEITKQGRINRQIKTELQDAEGITFNPVTNSFFLIDEGRRRIVEITANGERVATHKIGNRQESKNNGLEGVCYYPKDSTLFVFNENNPKELMKLSSNFKVKSDKKLKFGKDISGACVDKKEFIWLVSDRSQAVYKISLEGALLEKFEIPVPKAEGIVIVDAFIYIVSDQTESLYIFELPH